MTLRVAHPVVVVAQSTVIVSLPLCPSVVAVIVTVPDICDEPVTYPVESTVARVLSLDVHAKERPARMLPAASLAVAVSWMDAPSPSTNGVIATDATGARDAVANEIVTDEPSMRPFGSAIDPVRVNVYVAAGASG